MSEVIRESIRRYVAVGRFHVLRKQTIPLAEARDYLTDEDVFKVVT